MINQSAKLKKYKHEEKCNINKSKEMRSQKEQKEPQHHNREKRQIGKTKEKLESGLT